MQNCARKTGVAVRVGEGGQSVRASGRKQWRRRARGTRARADAGLRALALMKVARGNCLGV